MRRVCVFCGSSPGGRGVYADAAERFADALVERGLGLVYGGGNCGLMGILADRVLERGGEVIGVIPESLIALEVAHGGLSELRVVDSMHARKALMADLADAFVALPGGLGTFEELLEIYTWAQLGMHAKPIGVLDVEGYFEPLLRLLDHATLERFLRQEHRDLLVVADDAAALLDALAGRAPARLLEKWIDKDQR